MTKQFTIPCQFGQQSSPVTFYIGHPDNGHHPIHFQSNWLSSSKGGTVPQDLMMTLQKLHDLALENNADFEELCYYALISATQNSNGDGVSESEITSYADEYLKKELNGETDSKEQGIETIADGSENNNVEVGRAEDNANNNKQLSAISNENNSNNNDIATKKQTQNDVVMENNNNDQLSQTDNTDTNNVVNNNTTNKVKVIPTLNTDIQKIDTIEANNGNNEATNEDLLDTDLFGDELTEGNQPVSAILQKDNHSDNTNNTDDDILMDDSLLLDDDAIFNDDIEKENNVNSDKDNQSTYDKDGLDNEYDDLMDDEIIFDDDNGDELLDDFADTNNNNNTDSTTEDTDNLFMDDDLMDFGK